MNYVIHTYNKSDFPLLKSWWDSHNIQNFSEHMIPEGSTFILEYDDVPVVSIGVVCTNSKISYLENLIGNPTCDKEIRRNASKRVIDFAVGFAQSLGYKEIRCMTNQKKLADYYKTFDFNLAMENVSLLNRGL